MTATITMLDMMTTQVATTRHQRSEIQEKKQLRRLRQTIKSYM